MKLRPTLLCLVLFAAAVLGGPAWARPGDTEPDAAALARGGKLFRKAQRRYDAKRFDEALDSFREVDELLSSPNARLYAGRCLRELGRLAEAFDTMSSTVRLASEKAESDPSYLDTRDAAAAEREALVSSIGRVVIATTSAPPGLEIELAGRAIEADAIGLQLGVEPGTVEVTARASGFVPFRREIEVAAGSLETIAVALQPLDEGTDGATGSDDLQIAGFVTLGVGVASLGMFVIAGAMAEDRFATIEEECGTPPCTDPSYVEQIDGGKTMDLVANIGLGIGLPCVAAGTLMVIFGWPSDEDASGEEEDAPLEDEESLESSLSFDVGPGGGAIGYQLRF